MFAAVVGLLAAGAAGLSGAVAAVAAWCQVAATLVALGTVAGLIVEHLRFLRSGWPSVPSDAVVLTPVGRGRQGWRSTPRGLRRARLWATADVVGVVTWLHGETHWDRADVGMLRAVRDPQGRPVRLDLLGQHGQVLGVLQWPDWFEDERLDRLRAFGDRCALPVRDEEWHRRLGTSGRPIDGSEDFPAHAARTLELPHVAYAFGLLIVSLLCAMQAGRPSGGPGALGTLVGFVTAAACILLALAAFAVGWWDQRAVRR